MWELVITAILAITFINAIYQKHTNAFYKSTKKLHGKTAIVTGGTTGIGLEIAKDLASRGARVIICSPFSKEGTEGRDAIIKESGSSNVVFKYIDLSSLSSVREFAQEILDNEHRLDILINNAGIATCFEDPLTKDGLNYIMQVHYFGHFLLTILLLPLLKKSSPSRIINTASFFHRVVKLDMHTLNSSNHNCFTRGLIYAKAKLCNVLFTNELAERLNNSGVVANSVDPGAVGTRLGQGYGLVISNIYRHFVNLCFKTPKEGAQTAIFVAVDECIEGITGKYFQNCEEFWMVPWARRGILGKKLWEETVRLVKLTDEEISISLG